MWSPEAEAEAEGGRLTTGWPWGLPRDYLGITYLGLGSCHLAMRRRTPNPEPRAHETYLPSSWLVTRQAPLLAAATDPELWCGQDETAMPSPPVNWIVWMKMRCHPVAVAGWLASSSLFAVGPEAETLQLSVGL